MPLFSVSPADRLLAPPLTGTIASPDQRSYSITAQQHGPSTIGVLAMAGSPQLTERIIDRLLEHSAVFNVNQLLLDGGKHRPMQQFLSDVPYETVVDLGCGPGSWTGLTRGQYLGVDNSESFINTCRGRYKDDSEKRFIHGDITQLGLDESFDLALMISVLHHLSDLQAARTMEWVADHATYLFVMDLYPVPHNPVSRWLYRMDRGDHIREPVAQREIVTQTGRFTLRKENDFYSWNRLYRHTMFLFESQDE